VDLGRTKDYTAVVVLEVQSLTIVHAEKMPLGLKHETQAQRVAAIVARYGAYNSPAAAVVDCTGGATGGHDKTDAHLKFYRQQIPHLRPFYWQRNNKVRIIQNLTLALEQTRLKIPAQFTDIRDELLSYEFEHRAGYIDFHAGDNKHDDYVAALAMALDEAIRGRGPATSGSPLSTVWL
jgi:hypothetical protein